MEPIETIEHKGYKIEIIPDEDAQNPRSEDFGEKADTMVCFHSRYNLGDENHGYKTEDYMGWNEMEAKIIEDHNPVVIHPLYLYDHSGITISMSHKYPYNDRWDAGQVGFIFMSRKNALNNWQKSKKTSNQSLRPRVERFLKATIEEYDQYLRGDVYGFEITKDGEHVDSCWGYFGFDLCKNEAIDVVNYLVEQRWTREHMTEVAKNS